MKQRIFSILLVMALILIATTACANSQKTAPGTQAAPEAQSTTAAGKIIGIIDEQLPTFTKHECKLEYLNNCEYDKDSPILRMSPEEVSDYIAEMVHISQTDNLCWSCMNRIGMNFYDIRRLSSAYDTSELDAQAIVAFDNVFAQAVQKGIPFDSFDSWEYLPIAEILCKYYSAEAVYDHINFVGCSAPVGELAEEDLVKVAKVYFANPAFETNYYFSLNCLTICQENEAVRDLAWEHLIALSNSSSAELAREPATYYTCCNLFRSPKLLANTSKITTIAGNILQNPHFDFLSKYVVMCSDINEQTDMDKAICDLAFESLLELAQNADEETYEAVVDVTIRLYDKYSLETEEVEGLLHKYDVEALISCLKHWKEISKTTEPEYY